MKNSDKNNKFVFVDKNWHHLTLLLQSIDNHIVRLLAKTALFAMSKSSHSARQNNSCKTNNHHSNPSPRLNQTEVKSENVQTIMMLYLFNPQHKNLHKNLFEEKKYENQQNLWKSNKKKYFLRRTSHKSSFICGYCVFVIWIMFISSLIFSLKIFFLIWNVVKLYILFSLENLIFYGKLKSFLISRHISS